MKRTLFVIALLAALAVAEVHAVSPRLPRGLHGAIAYDAVSGATGYSFDFATSREARVAALNHCGSAQCEVVIAVRNSCAAIARATGAAARARDRVVATKGATRQEADTRARRMCGSDACEVVAWTCTK